jgi:probable DNA metabolism protein
MKRVTLGSQTDFDGWRTAARAAVLGGIPPEDIVWRVSDTSGDLFATDEIDEVTGVDQPAFNVSRAFVDLAKEVVLHTDPERFALLYRLLWRLRTQPHLLADASDADVDSARKMAKAIHRDIHKMHAFVRFKEIVADDGEPAFIAWFEPDHYIVEATADFFVRRFTGMRWSILTPHRSAFWDRETLRFGPGADKSLVPDEDRLEEHWRTYYASIFNPARLKIDAMQKEMPKKYWKNLPEASVIEGLIRDAGSRMDAMIEAAPTAPSRLASALDRQRLQPGPDDRTTAQSVVTQTMASADSDAPTSLDEARAAAARCTRCDLHGPATQVVFGEGPASAAILFVGEQPGDKEDLAGRPFVGPAGAVLNQALDDAGIARDQAYVTNAVKHFKYEPRGKFRLHKTPDAKEIQACRYWLDLEKSLLAPKIIVALGASAGQALLGRAVRVGAERGRAIPQGSDAPILLTVHPSYLLRLPDAASKEREYARFVADLASVKAIAGL